nr:MAG TPA: hypothetical protein [Caudoviricetes sp.]
MSNMSFGDQLRDRCVYTLYMYNVFHRNDRRR